MPVCVIEDQHGFLLHHEILWQGGDTDIAVPMIEAAQARFADLRACSFDRGFHSPANRVRLDALLEHNVLPGRGASRRPTAPAKRTRRSSRRAGSTRRSSRRSTTWSTAVSTGCGPTARTASPASSPSRCWPSTSIASGCCCCAGSRDERADEPPPDGGAVGPTGGNLPTGGDEPACPGLPKSRAPACRHGCIRPARALGKLESPRITGFARARRPPDRRSMGGSLANTTYRSGCACNNSSGQSTAASRTHIGRKRGSRSEGFIRHDQRSSTSAGACV